jgi:Kef-type K+ transport system membrane component KefB
VDVNRILLDILIVLLAAKLAAEIADRIGVPAVVGEIAAGVLIGPSALGLVHSSEALQTLAQLGVILLLLEVGLEMDLRELSSVGRASIGVAIVGVVLPIVAGALSGLALGMDGKEALFVGAALTATSVGITARVFGDLRALATVEARTVLGAAVADDILGLVILTVVTRIVTEGSVSPLGVSWVIVVAVGFIILTTVLGLRLAPPVFATIRRYSRSSGTLVALALAFTLGVSELAHAAELAPIVGAFVAGLVLSRTTAADRVRKELAPVGHLLIPVFFLQIGIEADVSQFAEPVVFGTAAVLLVVGVLGKLASAFGLIGSPGDRLLVGIGMVPRGEVGLIFATLGLQQGVFGQDVYAAMLLVVLVTTVATPPALRWRLLALRERHRGEAAQPIPSGAALTRVTNDGTVELTGVPLPSDALVGALTVARLAEKHPLGPTVLDWLNDFPPGPRRWDDRARDELWRLLREGGPRSWRLLSASGVLQRALPELDDALDSNTADAFDIDPLGALRFPRTETLRATLTSAERVPVTGNALLLAALILDVSDNSDAEPVIVARRTVQRLDLGARTEETVAGVINDAGLLPAAVRRIDAFEPEPVLQLAMHIETLEQLDALRFFSHATFAGDRWELDRLDALCDLVRQTLDRPDLVNRGALYEIERRRNEASNTSVRAPIRERIHAAPRDYVLSQTPDDLIRHAQLIEPAPGRREVRVRVDALDEPGIYRVEIATPDRIGLIARTTGVLVDNECSIESALAATWGDHTALTSYRVRADTEPDEETLIHQLRAQLDTPLLAEPAPGLELEFDDAGSPWYTRCTATATDRPGLLHTLATAFALVEVNVHSARITTEGATAVDAFELTGRTGRKLDAPTKDRVRAIVEAGFTPPRRRLPWTRRYAGVRVSAGVLRGLG